MLLLYQNCYIKIEKIAEILKLKPNIIKKNIKQLKDDGILKREGTNRKGKRIVINWNNRN